VDARLRSLLLAVAGLVVVALFVPPLATEARHYEFVEAIQFALAALVIPALLVLGAPWARLHLAANGGVDKRPFDRLAAHRLRHPEFARALIFLAIDMAVMVVWRTPGAVDALARHPWLVVVEMLSLAIAGTGLWLELVASPPFAPRVPRPWRAVLAALAMWIVWTVAYLLGLSHTGWYNAYHHYLGVGLSRSADQQISTGVLWFAAACAFLPVIFVDVMEWLKKEDDPDAELYRLVRAERRAEVRPPAATDDGSTRPIP